MTTRGRMKYTICAKGVWYFRRRGHKTVRLPGNPAEDPDAAELYWLAMRGQAPKTAPSGTSIAALVTSYRQSTRYPTNARTRKDYEKVIAYILDKNGSYDVRRVRRSDVIKARDANADRPRFANYVATMLSILFEHAIDLDWIRENPARGVKHFPPGEGYQPWPDWLIRNYRAEAEGVDLLAFELLLGTGQRIGDVLKMRWKDIHGDEIYIRQNKTGAEVWAPITPALRTVLNGTPRGLGTIIAQANGSPMQYAWLAKRMRKVLYRVGGKGYSAHGLRKNAAVEILELTGSIEIVRLLTGHETAQMAQEYAAKASGRKMLRKAQEERD